MNDNEFDNVDENKQKPQQMNFSWVSSQIL
jgi:hypothetical protein